MEHTVKQIQRCRILNSLLFLSPFTLNSEMTVCTIIVEPVITNVLEFTSRHSGRGVRDGGKERPRGEMNAELKKWFSFG